MSIEPLGRLLLKESGKACDGKIEWNKYIPAIVAGYPKQTVIS